MTNILKTLTSLNPKSNFNTHVHNFISLLKSISTKGSLTDGTKLHCRLIKMGLSSERYIAVKLLIFYLNHRRSVEVNRIKKGFDKCDVVVNNCLLSGYVEWGNINEARRVFDEMPERNEVSWTALISGLMKCGRVEEAVWYFELNPFHNVVLWTAAVSGFVQNGMNIEAVELFRRLVLRGVKPNSFTFTSVFRACTEMSSFYLGMSLLCFVIKMGFERCISVSNSLITFFVKMGEVDLARGVFDRMEGKDVVSWTAVLDMYVGMGDIEDARRVFDDMPKRNEVSWSAMIARYSQSGNSEEAFNLFSQMIKDGFNPNSSCFASIISLLAAIKDLRAGMNFHAHVLKGGFAEDVFVSSSLIDLYSKCGNTRDGYLVFQSISFKNIVTWNAMISGYSLNRQMEQAIHLFQRAPVRNDITWNSIVAGYIESEQFDEVFKVVSKMLLAGQVPSRSTFSSVLCACASTASIEKGKNFHAKAIKLDVHNDVYIGTALTDMYAKCGDMYSSKSVFDRMLVRNEFTWTALIQGLAENGFAEDSIMMFEEMERTSSITPNELMLLSVLFACSHSGLVDKGLHYFNLMETVYGIKPGAKHYTCVIDMLSRAGRLFEAEDLIQSMPFAPEANAVSALLSGCNTHKNKQIAERTVRKLWKMAEENPAWYVLLSNMNASSGSWDDVVKIRKVMKEKGLKKSGGCSWVEVKNRVHSFYSEDGSHSKSADIYDILELLKNDMLYPVEVSPFCG